MESLIHYKVLTRGIVTHSARGVFKDYFELSHGPDDGHEALYCVGVDHRPVLHALIIGVASLMDYFHLFAYCTLATLSSTCKNNTLLGK